jgi:hypothetical protein
MTRLLVVLLLGICACGGEGAQARGHAGLPTTESSPPYETWSLESEPVVRIGAVDGPPEYQLSRVAYAARLSDGRIVVVDGGSSELRWFGPDGAFQSRAGGRGEGPGELLRVVAGTATPQDSVVLYDARNQRLSWFGPEGSFSRTLRVELHGTIGLAPLRDARLLIADERPVFRFGGAEYNLSRDSILIMVLGGASAAVDTVVYRAGRAAITWVGYTDGTPTATRQFGLPFGNPTLVGGASGRIVMVEDGGLDLTFLDAQGKVIGRASRMDVNWRPLSASMRREYVRNTVERAVARGSREGLAKAGAEGLLEVMPEGRGLSAFDRMLTDAVAGRIWVRDYVPEWSEGEGQRWTVHDSIGQVLARVTTPAGLTVMQAGPSHVVGVERDEVGVEYVAVYSFH